MRQLKYLVDWNEYLDTGYTWLSVKECFHFQVLVKKHHNKFPSSVGQKTLSPGQNPTLTVMKLPPAFKNFSLSNLLKE